MYEVQNEQYNYIRPTFLS